MQSPGLTRLVASAAWALVLAASGAFGAEVYLPTRDASQWGFHDGREFGAAGGGVRMLAPDDIAIDFDFTKQGKYVSAGYGGEYPEDTTELVFEATTTDACTINYRLITDEDRCYQGHGRDLGKDETATITVQAVEMTYPEAWGGTSGYEGRVPRGRVKALHVMVGKSKGSGKGTVRVQKLRARTKGPIKPKDPGRINGEFHLRRGDTVLFMGDATTQDGGYARLVRERISDRYAELNAEGENGLEFVNAGVAGATVQDGLRKLPDLLAAHDPAVVVVCFGSNDAHADPSKFSSGMKDLLAALKEKSVSATVLTPISFDSRGRPELEGPAKVLDEMMSGLGSIASAAGALIADSYSSSKERIASGGEDLTWGDGIHPSPRGKQMMADKLQEAWRFGRPLSEWPQ